MADPALAVSLEDVRVAAAALAGVALRTPLLDVPALSERLGVPVSLKCENDQPVGAFKIRGAYTAIARLGAAERARGVVTHSSGNHGLAVAYAARRLGARAVIVMPKDAPRVKVEGVRGQEGEIVFVDTRNERESRAAALAESEGLVPVPPYEHADVIAGQGTCGLEILEDRPDVQTILVPVGGGGLLAGIAIAVLALKPSVRVVGVEPEGAAKLTAALAAGRPTRLVKADSLADGLLPLAIGDLPFSYIRLVVREAVTVTDEEIADAVRFLHEKVGIRVEPSGAVTTAALLSGRCAPAGTTVAVVSGGNVDDAVFERLVRA